MNSTKPSSIKETFDHIYNDEVWGRYESLSGSGSTIDQTVVLRRELPSILKSLQARTLLDAPCGDYFWMKELDLDLDMYIGVDIVQHIVVRNRTRYETPSKRFLIADITKDPLPRADCILCRACLDHLSLDDCLRALENFRRSGARYLLATTYAEREDNPDIITGDFRATNLVQPPFSFPPPLILINEESTEERGLWADKSMGIWRLEDTPSAVRMGAAFGEKKTPTVRLSKGEN